LFELLENLPNPGRKALLPSYGVGSKPAKSMMLMCSEKKRTKTVDKKYKDMIILKILIAEFFKNLKNRSTVSVKKTQIDKQLLKMFS
jgi:hypothetical protein